MPILMSSGEHNLKISLVLCSNVPEDAPRTEEYGTGGTES